MTTTASAPPHPDVRTPPTTTPLLQRGAVAVLLGVLISFVGGVWDIQWHSDVGPDTFFTAPHLLLYAGAMLVGLSSLTVVLLCTERARRPDVAGDPAIVPVLWRTFRAPLGFVVSGTGAALFLLAGLYDQWWHGLYGFDAVLDSPPHAALGLGDVASLFGGLMILSLLVARSRSWWPVAGLATAAAVFLANSASWQLGFPTDMAGGVNGQLLFIGLLYPLVLAMVASVVRRPWAATTAGLAMTLLVGVTWVFSNWATPVYAEAVGLYVRDDAPGLPEILAVLPKLVLPAALLLDGLLLLARRRGVRVRTGMLVAGAASAAALVVPEVLVVTGATLEPVGLPVTTVLLAAAAGAVGAWTGWKLGVVLRRLAAGPVARARGSRPARSGARAGAVAAAGLMAVALAAAPAGAAPPVSVVHTEAVEAGPYGVDVGFSEWPIRAERSLDIVFQPDAGIAGKEGTVTLIAPSGAEEERRLVRHPRMREAWGLDIIALPEEGRWTLRLDLEGPQGPGSGAATIDLLPRPGPPLALSALPTNLVFAALILALVLGWRRVAPARRPETVSWT